MINRLVYNKEIFRKASNTKLRSTFFFQIVFDHMQQVHEELTIFDIYIFNVTEITKEEYLFSFLEPRFSY